MRLTKLFAGLAGMTLMLSVGAASAYDAEFDYNNDGVVDQADIDILNSHFGYGEGDEGYVAAFDHDGDGMVGGTDVVQALAAVDGN
jgi:hypothetical protein